MEKKTIENRAGKDFITTGTKLKNILINRNLKIEM